jgi:thioredoxin reductase (NADPH)
LSSVSRAPHEPIPAAVLIVGAGPCGLFQVFELGLLGIGAHVIDSLARPGGRVRNTEELSGKRLVIFGGGDSALDWTLQLATTAAGLTLVHRREEFSAAPASVARMRELAAAGRIRYLEAVAEELVTAGDQLQGVHVRSKDGTLHQIAADHLLAFFGLHPKLGPIAEWGLALERKALRVDTEKFQTSLPGVFAVGDINTYPGKKKLILSGFHEAALAAFGIQQYLYPQKKSILQYTTTSPALHKRLGVKASAP